MLKGKFLTNSTLQNRDCKSNQLLLLSSEM
jgi:hypothetical protein